MKELEEIQKEPKFECETAQIYWSELDDVHAGELLACYQFDSFFHIWMERKEEKTVV